MCSMRSQTHEHATYTCHPDLYNLELLRAYFVTQRYSPHIHEGFAIGVIEEGAEQFTYRGAQYCAPAGAIVLINPQEVHTGSSYLTSGCATACSIHRQYYCKMLPVK